MSVLLIQTTKRNQSYTFFKTHDNNIEKYHNTI